MELPKLKKVTDAQLKRPKILLLSDDMFTTSGIATMSRAFVFGTADRFNWVQLAAAINHHAAGQVIDASNQVTIETGVTDASLKLYPNNGYGDPETLRRIIEIERPDAILHFTDPRYWTWLYQMEHELHNRYNIPIAYYAIWDNYPYPHWNKSAYGSCDLIMAISKQSHLIHNKVLEYADIKTHDLNLNPDLKSYKSGDVLTSYVPHGVDSTVYRPIKEGDSDWDEYNKFMSEFKTRHNADFVLFWTNRNIRRKQPADVIHAFKLFTDRLDPEKKKRVVLLMHTAPRDVNGTDLVAVKKAIAPDCNVIFSVDKLSNRHLNYYYNLADVTLNIGSNEGFGLSSLESIMAGTCIINNVTGGLQDQMRFVDNEGKWFTPSNQISSNHRKTYTECGEWAFPVFPSNMSIQGSLETPYIFDDRAADTDIADVIYQVYLIERSELKQRGLLGREWAMGTESCMEIRSMSDGIANGLNSLLSVWKGGKRYDLYKVDESKKIIETGITL
jgi:glycosyltransferase involved in cell wall biosynthesis